MTKAFLPIKLGHSGAGNIERVGRGGVGEKPFEGFASTGPSSPNPRPTPCTRGRTRAPRRAAACRVGIVAVRLLAPRADPAPPPPGRSSRHPNVNHLCGYFGFGCLDPLPQLLPGKHLRLAILHGRGEFLVVGLPVLVPPRGLFRFGSEGRYCALALLFHRFLSGKSFLYVALAGNAVTARTLPSRSVQMATSNLPESVMPTDRYRSSPSTTSYAKSSGEFCMTDSNSRAVTLWAARCFVFSASQSNSIPLATFELQRNVYTLSIYSARRPRILLVTSV